MRAIKKGLTDQSVVIRIIDSADGTPETGVVFNTTGIDLWYRREGAVKTSITEATLSALNDAHSDGGILHIGDGYYRLDLPDAAVATGANGVQVGGTVTGMIVIGCYVHLLDVDLQDAVRLGLTSLPNAAADAAGGLPISDAGGLDLDTFLGRITGNVALASVLGALADAAVDGDPTTSDTIMQYVKQIVNTLVGSAGVPTYPSAAAAGNAVSLAEALRYVSEQVGAAGAGLTTRASQASVDDLPTNAELATALASADDAVLAILGTPAGASVSADIAAIEAQTDDIGAAGAGLTALATAAELAKVPKSDSNVTWNATAAAQIQSEANDALVAQNLDHLVKIAADTDFPTTVHADSVIGQLADNGAGFDRATDSLEAIRDNVGAAGAGLTAVPWNAAWDAEVQSEVTDALAAMFEAARAEPGQGTPAVNATALQKLDYAYKFLRNKITQDATTIKVFADDGSTVDHKATQSDDGTTYTRGEFATGP